MGVDCTAGHQPPPPVRRAIYQPAGAAAEDAAPTEVAAASAVPDRGAAPPVRRSRRILETDARVAQGVPMRPVLCSAPPEEGTGGASGSGGGRVPLHEADLVLCSYELLREQLYGEGGDG